MRLLLIILAIYIAVRLLGRLLMPFMNKNTSSRGSGSAQSRQDNRREGDVTIEYTDKNKKNRKGDSGEGDYVDFEELD
ncbi:hypothetical protein O3Q51_11030 [Cryomorphaceae bacterium 1068]|nr:hypothetical protein [Cryomorphaceae bacterium 1068]